MYRLLRFELLHITSQASSPRRMIFYYGKITIKGTIQCGVCDRIGYSVFLLSEKLHWTSRRKHSFDTPIPPLKGGCRDTSSNVRLCLKRVPTPLLSTKNLRYTGGGGCMSFFMVPRRRKCRDILKGSVWRP